MAEATIQLPPDSTGKNLRALTGGAAQPASTYQEVDSLAGPGGHLVDVRPDGLMKVALDPTSLFVDTFDTALDTTNRWTSTVGSAGTNVSNAGVLTSTLPATSGAFAVLTSQPTFAHSASSFISAQAQATLPAAPGTAFHRFFGFGTAGATPTVALPLTDAIGFAVKTDGFLYAVVWAAGVEVFSQRVDNLAGGVASASVMDGSPHRLQVLVRSDRCYFFVDSLAAPAATTNFNAPAVSTLPVRWSIVSNAATAATWISGVITVSDWARNNRAISDPTFQWRRANVDQIGTKGALDVNLAGSAGGIAATGPTALTGSGSSVSASVGFAGNVTVVIYGGTFTNLPIIFEGSLDGTNWFPIDGARADGTGVDVATTLPNATATVVRAWNLIAPGYQNIRVRQTAAAGAQSVNPNVLISQGPFLYDPSPAIAPIDGQKQTYSASGTSAVATAFAIGYLQGSATKLVKLIALRLTGTATAAAVVNVSIGRYSTAPTAGTSTSPTVAVHDTANAAATAVPRQYSAAPTGSGTLVAVIRTARMLLSTAATSPTIVEFTFGNRPGQGIALRGTSEFVTIVPPAAAGASWAFDFEWTEESL